MTAYGLVSHWNLSSKSNTFTNQSKLREDHQIHLILWVHSFHDGLISLVSILKEIESVLHDPNREYVIEALPAKGLYSILARFSLLYGPLNADQTFILRFYESNMLDLLEVEFDLLKEMNDLGNELLFICWKLLSLKVLSFKMFLVANQNERSTPALDNYREDWKVFDMKVELVKYCTAEFWSSRLCIETFEKGLFLSYSLLDLCTKLPIQ